jgi:hypothetical protein
MSETIAELQTAIDNVHGAIIKCTDQVVGSLSRQANYTFAAQRWVEYAHQLIRLVPDYAVPRWLTLACSEFGEPFSWEPSALQSFAIFTTTKAPEIKQPILIGEGASLNVEELFQEQADKVQLSDVFERLVSTLSELIALDVIDNRLVHESLTRLNALFRRNKHGSFAAVLLTMNFGRFFLNSFGGILRANKYAKPIVDSFEKEFSEASVSVQQAEEATKKEMIARLTNPARMKLFLESNPQLQATISGYLPSPDTSAPLE